MEVQFYHLLATPLEKALPKLMEKALASGALCAILCRDEAQMAMIDDALWTYDPHRFLPHGTADKPHADVQPICLTTQLPAPNHASIAVVTGGQMIAVDADYAKVLDVFDGHNEDAVLAARSRWKDYQHRGAKLSYIQQQKDGGWQVKQAA